MTARRKVLRALAVVLILIAALYLGNRGCSPSNPFFCWTPDGHDTPWVDGARYYTPYTARKWHKICDKNCRAASECYYFCCKGDYRLDRREKPENGRNCSYCFGSDKPDFFGEDVTGKCPLPTAGLSE